MRWSGKWRASYDEVVWQVEGQIIHVCKLNDMDVKDWKPAPDLLDKCVQQYYTIILLI